MRFLICFLLCATAAVAQDLPIARLADICFQVGDLEKARQFHAGILGLEEAFTLKDSQGKITSAFFKVNDDQFLRFSPGPVPSEGYALTGVTMLTPDIERLRTVLQGRKLAPGPVEKRADGNLHFTLKDPDQTDVDFIQYTASSLQSRNRGKSLGPNRFSDHLLHAGVACDREADAMTFYRDQLGFREFLRGGPAPGDTRWINLMMPGSHGDYMEVMIQASAPRAARMHMCFEVPDIQRTYKQLVSRGLPERFKPFLAQNHRWIMNLRDSYGIRVEIMGEEEKR